MPEDFGQMSTALREAFQPEAAPQQHRSQLAPEQQHHALHQQSITSQQTQELPYPLDPQQIYTIEPDSGYRAMNASPNERQYFFNGMQMDQEKIYLAGKELANKLGRDITVVPNQMEEQFMEDLATGFVQAVCSGENIHVEKEAVELSTRVLLEEFENHEAMSRIICYSKGNLTLKRTFEVFEHKINSQIASLAPEQQGPIREKVNQFLQNRLEVWRTGSAYNAAPAGVKSLNLQHTGDPVAMLGHVFTGIDVMKAKFQGKEISVSETVIANPRGTFRLMPQHSIRDDRTQGNYIDDLPLFALRRFDHLKPEEQAQKLVESIQRGDFSQPTYDEIVHEFFHPRDEVHGLLDNLFGRMNASEKQVFAKALLNLAPQGIVGKNQFSSSTMKTLESIAKNGMQEPKPRTNYRAGDRLRPGSKPR